MNRSVRSVSTLSAMVMAVGLLWPADAYAQRGRAAVRVSSPRLVRTFVRPYYYRPFYSPFFWGSPWGPYGFYPPVWYAQYPRHRYVYDEASLRLNVTPREAQVYVDGYYVGTVDSFDGTFQRLHLSPGEHLIEIYLEGYRTIRETMMFQPRAGYQLRRTMEPLAPGEPRSERPRPDPDARRAPPSYPGDSSRGRSDDVHHARPGQIRSDDGGAVVIRVQPDEATVIVDGQKWDTLASREPLVLHLTEGAHRIEVQKNGYRTFTTEVRVRRGETIPLNISLRVLKED